MTANAPLGTGNTPVPWGKRYRTPLMNTAFWLFWLAFPLAYLGGVRGEGSLINISFILFCAACLVPLVTKK
ncbi:MAG TPA: hypothetical protein PKA10_03680 [Selenomonadales bacterium]|nr:hypothetical protein [Selenomonadales bacterium]